MTYQFTMSHPRVDYPLWPLGTASCEAYCRKPVKLDSNGDAKAADCAGIHQARGANGVSGGENDAAATKEYCGCSSVLDKRGDLGGVEEQGLEHKRVRPHLGLARSAGAQHVLSVITRRPGSHHLAFKDSRCSEKMEALIVEMNQASCYDMIKQRLHSEAT
ncbi:hypothetical protein ACQ4PT_003253 [Festuca glaucescens]